MVSNTNKDGRKSEVLSNSKKEYFLTPEGIDDFSAFISDTFEALNIEKKEVLRLRLTFEEVLLKWLPNAEYNDVFSVEIRKKFKKISVKLTYKNKPLNPFVKPETEDEFLDKPFSQTLLENLGIVPIWQYKNGLNAVVLSYKTKKTLSYINQVIISALLGIVCGICGLAAPDNFTSVALNSVITPFFNAIMGLLSLIIGPMMFFSIIWGIYNIGDSKQLGTIGKKIILRFSCVLICIAAFCTLISLTIFDVKLGGSTDSSNVFRSIIEMVLNIIPKNIIDPFQTGNTLQILFMGILVGIAMVILKEKMDFVGKFIEQANSLVMLILSWIGSLMPIFIFLSVVRLMLQESFTQNGSKLLVPVCVCISIMAIDMLIQTLSMLKHRILPIKTLKKLSTHTLICLSTASSSAGFSAMSKCCKKSIGIKEKVTNFALPFGTIFFKPDMVISFIVVPLFLTTVYSVEISISTIILCFLNAIILSVATPPMAGCALSLYTLIFMQIGIPLDALPIAIAIQTILDFPGTANKNYDMVIQLTHTADKMEMLDKNILLR